MKGRPPFRTSVRTSAVLSLVALLAACPSSGGGGGTPTFAKSYGSDALDLAADVAPTPDGGYVMVGSFNGRSVAGSIVDEDLWVTRLDAYGDLVWSKVFSENQTSVGTAEDARIYHINASRVGGGFFLVGTQDDLVAVDEQHLSPEDVAVARLDDEGNTVWTRTFGFAALPMLPLYDPSDEPTEVPTSVAPTPDGGLLIGGFSRAYLRVEGERQEFSAPWVMKVDGNGNREWSSFLQADLYLVWFYTYSGVYVANAADGGAFVALGEVHVDSLGAQDPLTQVVRLDPQGTQLWSRQLDDLLVEDLHTAERTGAGESVLLVGTDIDRFSPDDHTIVLLDAAGTEVDRRDVSAFEEILSAVELTPVGETEDYYGAVGRTEGDGVPDHLRLEIFDRFLDPVAQVDLEGLTSLFDLRAFDEGAFHGFEILASTLEDPSTRTGNLINVRIAPDGGILRYTIYDRDVPSFVSWRFSNGLRGGGWVDGTTNYWLWTQQVPEQPSVGVTLARYGLTSGQMWSHTFAPAFDRRVERGLQVEVIDDGDEDPSTFEIAVLGQVAWAPFENPPPPDEPLSAWLLRLDPDGGILSQKVLEELTLPYDVESFGPLGGLYRPDLRRSAHYLETTSDGGLFVAGTEDGYDRVVRLDASSNVVWCSRPLVDSQRTPIVSLEATEDGGVVALADDWMVKLDADGEFVWRQDFSRGGLGGVCELEGGVLVVAVSTVFAQQALGLDVDGSILWQVELESDGGLGSDRVVGVTATADRSAAVLAYGTLNPIASAPSGTALPDDTWDLQLVSVDGTGTLAWSQAYGGLLEEALGDVCPTPDGGLVLAGRSDSLGVDSEAWLLRMDSCGVIREGCQAGRVRIDPLGATPSTLNLVQAALATVPPADDLPGTVSTATTAAREVSVTSQVVVARQCSGTSKDVEEVLLTVVIEAGSGTVYEQVGSGETPRVTCTGTCQVSLPKGSVLRLRGEPDVGFGLPSWSGGDCAGGASATCRVTMDGERTVRVSFPVDEGGYMGELYALSIDFQGSGAGSVAVQPVSATCTADCTFADLALPGDTFQLVATPAPGSSFGGWSGIDQVDGTFASLTFRAADRTAVVRFD